MAENVIGGGDEMYLRKMIRAMLTLDKIMGCLLTQNDSRKGLSNKLIKFRFQPTVVFHTV